MDARRATSRTLLLNETLPERKDDQEVDIPQARLISTGFRWKRIEPVQVGHELLLIEHVEELIAVELDGIYQIYGMVHGGDNEALQALRAPRAIPTEVIRTAVKEKGISRQSSLANMLMCYVQDASREAPVRRGAQID
jgi:hypothetical protein